MQIKGVLGDNAVKFEGTVIEAVGKLCDVFERANPKIVREDASVIAECATGVILFRGTPDEMRRFNEASRLISDKYEKMRKASGDFTSSHMIRIGLTNVKDEIVEAMEFIKQCAPKASLNEAFDSMAASGYAY